MSLGFGRGLSAIACLTALCVGPLGLGPARAFAQTPAPQQPTVPQQAVPVQQQPVPAQPPRQPQPAAPAPQQPTVPQQAVPVQQQPAPAQPPQRQPQQAAPTQQPAVPQQAVPAQQQPAVPQQAAPAQQRPVPEQPASSPSPSPSPSPDQPPDAVSIPKVPPTPEAIERARTAYARGQQAFAAQDFSTALTAFEEAYANVANPIVLVSIGECAAKLGRVETALAAYDAYLRTRPDAPDRDEVAQKRAALAESQVPGQLTLTSEPAGADVILDGQLIGRVTPVVLEARPGAHRVSLVLTGYETERLEVQLSPGGQEQRAATLKPQPLPPVVQKETVPPPQPEPPPVLKPEPPRAAIIVTASLGAAGVIAGSVLGIFALMERSDYNTQPTEAGADRGERLALFSDVGFGIGAMSLITTAVLLFTHDPPRSPEDKDSARFQLTPSFTTQSASATAKIRF